MYYFFCATDFFGSEKFKSQARHCKKSLYLSLDVNTFIFVFVLWHINFKMGNLMMTYLNKMICPKNTFL